MTSLRRRALAATGVAAIAALTLSTAPAQATPGEPAARPRPRPAAVVPVQILGINDFHGNLEPPAGSGGTVTNADGTTTPAGGAEYLSTHLKQARSHAQGASYTVSVGDNFGASPFLSASFYEEPTVEALNIMGFQASAVGNHELDAGWTELQRLQWGGCHKADNPNKQSCALHTYRGAKFPYLAANIHDRAGRILAPFTIRFQNGAPVAFIGLTLKGAPEIVSASGIKTLRFDDEIAAGNRTARLLRLLGVKAMVAMVHQGGTSPKGTAWNYTCSDGSTVTGDIVPVAKGLSPDIDIIMTAHSHATYACDIKDPAGQKRLVTQGGNYGRLYTEINAGLDRRTRDFVRSSVTAENHVVTRDVAKDPRITSLIEGYKAKLGPIANRKVGMITAEVKADRYATGSTPLGNMIADAQVSDPSAVKGGVKPVIAFMNPGGIRADLTYASSPAGEGDGVVTYQEAYSVQPFNNYVVSMNLTGQQVYDVLNQQWSGSYPKILQVSAGFSYSYTVEAAGKGTVTPGSVTLNGTPISLTQTYRVVANSFLSDGGDGFTTFASATDKYFGGLDVDAFVRYLGEKSPYTPSTEQRVVKK